MKLIAVFTPSHERLKDDWFLRTLRDDYELCVHPCEVRGPGTYMQEDWRRAVLFKSERIIEAIEDNWNEVFVYSDVDVVFFRPTKAEILAALTDRDIVCQLDDPVGNLCTGFFGARANEATLRLWRDVHRSVEREGRDQLAFNRLLRQQPGLRAGALPSSFFGAGTFAGRYIDRRQRVYIPPNAAMFHANWTLGVENKVALLARAHDVVRLGGWPRRMNNLRVGVRHLAEDIVKRAPTSVRRRSPSDAARPASVALDVSTACQLKCPSCPTANGTIARSLGAGFMTLANFEKFITDHPWVSDIELSNWGEVFLNKELVAILRLAHRHHVAVRIDNGANLDRASDTALEALVRYNVRGLTCSIDGASREVYSTYRINGDFDRVLSHIRKINAFKRQYRSPYPVLRWQFIAFGHNTHEIDQARAMAAEFGMEFYLKLSWHDLYASPFSPVQDRDRVRQASATGVADRQEYERRFGRSYIAASCHQLWLRPRINHDGRLLGCSINHWDDFGNVFTRPLDSLLRSDKVVRTKEMLQGRATADDSPCLRCDVYRSMKEHDAWVSPEALLKGEYRYPSRLSRRIRRRLKMVRSGLARVTGSITA